MAHGGVPPTLPAPRAGTGDPGGAVLWTGCADQACGPGGLPRPVGARASGSARGAGLVDGLPPAGCGASGTLSSVWATAGLPRQGSTPADFTTRGGRGVSTQQGVDPGQLREGSSLTPCPGWPGKPQGSYGGLERTVSAPPHRPLEVFSGGRSVHSRMPGGSKVHRPVVRGSVRGPSNPVLKRTAAGAGVPLSR
jgi:hypothetical protein